MKVFRACTALRYVLLSWRVVRVVFIPKPGHVSYVRAKSFRPISLNSFLLKTVERLVDRYIRDGTLVEYPLHSHQHAHQTDRSTETALHSLVYKTERALEDGLITLGH
jgi:hypothetical protein